LYESAKQYDKLYRSIYGLPDPEPEATLELTPKPEPKLESKPTLELKPKPKSKLV
jgi:starch synthase